jgi:hypothetical protein
MFDAESFLNQTTAAANATVIPPVPEGEYIAIIKSLKARVNNDGSVVMDVTWDIDDQNLKEQLKRKMITTRQSVWLDLDSSGNLASGEADNVALGRLRAAVGQNKEGTDWSPQMLIGKAAKIKVGHQVDKQTSEIRDQVKAVTALN